MNVTPDGRAFRPLNRSQAMDEMAKVPEGTAFVLFGKPGSGTSGEIYGALQAGVAAVDDGDAVRSFALYGTTEVREKRVGKILAVWTDPDFCGQGYAVAAVVGAMIELLKQEVQRIEMEVLPWSSLASTVQRLPESYRAALTVIDTHGDVIPPEVVAAMAEREQTGITA